MGIKIRFATIDDVSLILYFIQELATFEKLRHEVTATEELLREKLFGLKRYAEVIFAYQDDQTVVGFALFFHNFSTFLAKPGIYLEDLFVMPQLRGQGIGKKMLGFLADLAIKRDCGRLEWWVLDWNKSAIDFYRSIGAIPMDEWTVQRISGEALNALASLAKE
jgi:GNAT superfamily N-acetyltransferase